MAELMNRSTDHMMHEMGDMANGTGGGMMHRRHHMMMHMTFFWGKNTLILFPGWPGYDNLGMYILALVVVFIMAVLVEWLSGCNYLKESSNRVAAGSVQILMHLIRIGLAYLVMLAVMSFNVGVFVVAVAGHALGFFFFGSRVSTNKTTDLPPLSCTC